MQQRVRLTDLTGYSLPSRGKLWRAAVAATAILANMIRLLRQAWKISRPSGPGALIPVPTHDYQGHRPLGCRIDHPPCDLDYPIAKGWGSRERTAPVFAPAPHADCSTDQPSLILRADVNRPKCAHRSGIRTCGSSAQSARS
jgi:hypothetical protein